MTERAARKTFGMRCIEHEYGGRDIEKLLREGLETRSIRELAKEWGIHYTLLYDWCRLFGIRPPGYRRVSAEGSGRLVSSRE